MDVTSDLCSVIIVCTNEKHHLADCLPSLRKQSMKNFETLVVDNGSTDGSPEWVEANFPEVRVIRNGANIGYAPANNAGFRAARGDVLVVLNPDTEVHPDWLRELVRELDLHPEAGMATSRACFFDDRERVNTCGNDVHVGGLGYCKGLDDLASDHARSGRVASVSGCSFAVRRRVLDEIGGFDDEYFIYVEDTDLSLRAALAGYQIRYAAGSVLYHKYLLKLRPHKFFLLERNRSLTLYKNLGNQTLALLSPALLAFEAAMWVYAAGNGREFVAAKARAYAWLVQNRKRMRTKKREVQGLRRVSDRELVSMLTPELPLRQMMPNNRVTRLAEGVAGLAFTCLAMPTRLIRP